MQHDVRARFVQHLLQRLAITDVAVEKTGIRNPGQFAATETQVVQHEDLIAFLLQVFAERGTDEARATGDEDLFVHALFTRVPTRRDEDEGRK